MCHMIMCIYLMGPVHFKLPLYVRIFSIDGFVLNLILLVRLKY
jgi:hypothetical protein